jgi:transketolase
MPKTLANAVRFLSIDMVEKAKSGHPGMPMGMADVATILFKDFLKFNPKDPNWFNRDRFILSAGHGSALLYSLLYLTGYEDMTLDQLKNFRQIGSITPGHPEYGIATGIETTTGPLGQGISNAVGIALAERILNAKYGDALVNHKTYVICSDGDLMEGISHEACSFAGHMKLNNLIVLYDSNKISIDGSTELSFSDNTAKRFEAYGWSVMQIDGHNEKEIYSALAGAQHAEKPVLIKCKTVIGFGSPNKEGKHEVHGSPLGADAI